MGFIARIPYGGTTVPVVGSVFPVYVAGICTPIVYGIIALLNLDFILDDVDWLVGYCSLMSLQGIESYHDDLCIHGYLIVLSHWEIWPLAS